MRDISYLMSYGKHYFDIDELAAQVFTGSLGFRNDIKQYSIRHKTFSIVRYNEKEWIAGAVLLKIIRWLQRDGINSHLIDEFVAFLKREGVKTTRKRWSSMVWKEVGFRQNWCCNNCKSMLKPTFELDHIVALQDDGVDSIDNLQGLCVECHARKTRDRRLKEVVYSFKTSPIQVKTSKYFDEWNYRPKKKIKLEN